MSGNNQPDIFRLMAEHYPGLMLVIAVESETILYASAAWRNVLNREPSVDLSLKDVIHADDYRIVLGRIYQGGQDQQTVKLKHRIQQATYSVETEFIPLPDGCVLAVSTDTTGSD
ncbi:MAG: PAS domain-containing protein, partial [Anaerolineae bacterium]|nr:PAS domain-containing protein [Anaerolineae bacterium]